MKRDAWAMESGDEPLYRGGCTVELEYGAPVMLVPHDCHIMGNKVSVPNVEVFERPRKIELKLTSRGRRFEWDRGAIISIRSPDGRLLWGNDN